MVAGEGLEPPTRRFTYGTNEVSERTSLDVSNAAYFYRPQQNAIDLYTPNALNQYATVNAQSYVYDGNGNLIRRFVPGAGFGEIIATVEASPSGGGLRYFHHEDGLGSTVARSNDAGWITEINAYGPLGEGTAPHGANDFGFTASASTPRAASTTSAPATTAQRSGASCSRTRPGLWMG